MGRRSGLQGSLTVARIRASCVPGNITGSGWLGEIGSAFPGVLTGTVSQPSTRFADLSDRFSYYRIKKLRYRFHPCGYTVAVGICSFTDVTSIVPTGTAQIFDSSLTPIQITSPATVPTEWANVDCTGPLLWYKTSYSVGSEQNSQFTIFAFNETSATTTSWGHLELDALVEFRSPVNSSLNPRPHGPLARDNQLEAAGQDADTDLKGFVVTRKDGTIRIRPE